MPKKEIKENLTEFRKTSENNLEDLKALSILDPILPKQQSLLYSQSYIQNNVNIYTKEKAFNITLPNGSYKCNYTSNGSHMLVTGMDGYMASFNTQNFELCFESEIGDKIYDSKWLHNEQYFATAQEDCVFVYDGVGTELHAVRDMRGPIMLEFLSYHFLLASATNKGFLDYLDTSIGEVVSSLYIADPHSTAIKASPVNGVVHLGSKKGQVSLWAPSQKSFLMKIKCNKSAITGIEIDRTGNHLITTGTDNRINVFDIRNTYKPLRSIQTKANVQFTALSQRNLLAIGYSDRVTVLKDYDHKQELYLKHRVAGQISSLNFCNHEDILAIGHRKGFSTIVVPGSGDPMYDSTEVSPFTTVKQRKEMEVKKLLEKIPFDMIGLKSVLGSVKESEIKAEETEKSTEEVPRNALSRFVNRR